ncbi:MAG: AarF/UbiB family protein [Proteobacteria bacterium]|nr:AarF/UbiB family protein [Pseudomonadota bacterium]
MTLKQPIQRATFRFLKAYTTAWLILLSYAWLAFRARLWGDEYRELRIDALHVRNAARIEKAILSLQGMFIKIGQLFSIMTSFLPETLRVGLSNLQDAVPARPFEQIRMQIAQELGASPEALFASFQEEPIASASLGQVHLAETRDHRKVAVKVRHPDVEKVAAADLKTVWRVLNLVKRFVKMRGLDNYYHEIRAMVFEELDFRKESENLKAVAANFAPDSGVVFPTVLDELSTSRVLTLEYISGTKITDVATLTAKGLNPSHIAERLLTVYCQMIFVDGIYHADPHPGNILIRDDGAIALLDFGAVGHLSASMRSGLISFLEAIIKGNEEQLLQSLKDMGFLRIGTDQTEAATRVIEHFHQKFQEEIHLTNFSFSSINIDASKGFAHLADLNDMNVGLRQITSAFKMPREWVLLERTALLLAGICSHLDPQLKPAQIIRPYLEKLVLDADRDWSELLFDFGREKFMSFLALPRLFEKFANGVLAGNVSVRINGMSSAARLLYLAVQQLSLTLLIGTSVGAGLYFHSVSNAEATRIASGAGVVLFVLLLLNLFRAGRTKP